MNVEGNWQSRCAAYNHDWLQNEYLLKQVRAFVNRLSAPRSSVEDLRRFLETEFPLWEAKRQEAEWLVEAFEREMSPRVLFRSSPLSMCRPNAGTWLANLVDALWKSRYPVDTWVRSAREALDGADACYRRAVTEVADTRLDDTNERLRLAKIFEEFDERCTAFGQALSALPHKVLVI